MFKKLVFLSLIAFSLQIDNCLGTDNECKACKNGYTFVDSVGYPRCEKSDSVFLGDSNDGCLYYSSSSKVFCIECKKGYLMSSDIKNPCKKAPENCKELDNNFKCRECRHFYKLTDDKQCEKTSCYNFVDGKCVCDDEYYLFEDKECRKIPVKYCEEWDATSSTCKKCYEVATKDGNGGCKLVVEYEDDDDDDTDYKENIPNCISYADPPTNSKCQWCKSNYEVSLDQKECIYLCTQTEERCYYCKDNYFLSNNKKTCEIIDPYYKEDNSKFININLATFAILLFFIY